MFTIDQNCGSLWDVVPKLHALARRGHQVRHFIEDIDVAFTAMGARAGQALRVERERFHRSGGADWGAALFYSEFLGRLPVEIRNWEPFVGMKTAALAHRLGRGVDDLYDEFSPGDNWQLIGPSYVGDREHHRVMGDLAVSETADFIREMMLKARENTLAAFPSSESRRRTLEWFARETARLDELLSRHSSGTLVDLYRGWLGLHVGESVRLDAASTLFDCVPGSAQVELLERFTADYPNGADLYNQAVAQADLGLHPLKTAEGELPFFATVRYSDKWVRTPAYLRDGQLRLGEAAFPLDGGGRLPTAAMRSAGVRSLAGKAILLVIQARVGPGGDELAVPYRGSAYLPAAAILQRQMSRHGMLPRDLRPLVRVRFNLLRRLTELDTVIHLPPHLAEHFGKDEIPAKVLGQNYQSVARSAASRLAMLRDDDGRKRWQKENLPGPIKELDELDRRRRELAATDPKGEQIRELSRRHKAVQVRVLDATLRRIANDYQASEIEYWDSRGAILPWAVALGGEAFYDSLVAQAQVYPEPEAAKDEPQTPNPKAL